MFKQKQKAFTLIELLVVISIISILVVLAVIALNNTRSRARDAKRVADVKQMQTALELYFNENNSYPSVEEFTIGGALISSSTNSILMTEIPSAPSVVDGNCESHQYEYRPLNDQSSYEILFCTGGNVLNFLSGNLIATPLGVSAHSDFLSSGYSLRFNGSNNYVNMSDSSFLPFGTSAFSVSFWFKAAYLSSSWHTLFETRPLNNTTGIWFGVYNRKLQIYQNVDKFNGVQTISTDQWYHAVVIGNGGADGNRDIKVFLNGQQEGDVFTSNYNLTNIRLFFGTYHSYNFYWNGLIDDIKIYNRALSDIEVEQLYDKRSISNDLLSAYWNFNEGQGTIANDSSGNENNGTLIGAPTWLPFD